MAFTYNLFQSVLLFYADPWCCMLQAQRVRPEREAAALAGPVVAARHGRCAQGPALNARGMPYKQPFHGQANSTVPSAFTLRRRSKAPAPFGSLALPSSCGPIPSHLPFPDVVYLSPGRVAVVEEPPGGAIRVLDVTAEGGGGLLVGTRKARGNRGAAGGGAG